MIKAVPWGSVQFSCSLSNCLWPCGLQQARLPCPSPALRACSNSCPSNWCCHPTSYPLSSPSPPAFNLSQHQGLSQWVSSSHQAAQVLEFQSFSISPSSEYSGLISFRMDWLDLLAVQGTLKESSATSQFKSINSSVLSFLYGPALTSIHDYWKNHSFE